MAQPNIMCRVVSFSSEHSGHLGSMAFILACRMAFTGNILVSLTWFQSPTSGSHISEIESPGRRAALLKSCCHPSNQGAPTARTPAPVSKLHFVCCINLSCNVMSCLYVFDCAGQVEAAKKIK